jgi:hypothetical protein
LGQDFPGIGLSKFIWLVRRVSERQSSAPGPGGAPLNMAMEVREVMSAPPA